ncbi:MAG: DUF6443 domain-containing protein, partial [Bacteroidota bacterium]
MKKMKNILVFMCLLLCTAQQAISQQVNSIREYTPKVPLQTIDEVKAPTSSVDRVQVATSYIDGLGREVQTNILEGSTSRKDLVAPIVYDRYGRVVKAYLPYTAANEGAYAEDALADQQRFYQDHQATERALTRFPYSQNTHEPSPLNRITHV